MARRWVSYLRQLHGSSARVDDVQQAEEVEENVDEYSNEDITDYFMEAESDNLDKAFDALSEDDITLEEIKLVRISFLSSMAN